MTIIPHAVQIAGSAVKTADLIRDQVLLRIEPVAAVRMNKPELTAFVDSLVAEIANERKLLLNQTEQNALTADIVDEMIGLGPIEPLLHDHSVADILVNGPHMIYVERHGKLELTGLRFRHDAHILHVAQRIASFVGRSIDESNPMLDARLADGSRVNVIIPPLSLKGPSISIRKFSQKNPEPQASGCGGLRVAGTRHCVGDFCPLPAEHHHLGRHRLRQNHPP